MANPQVENGFTKISNELYEAYLLISKFLSPYESTLWLAIFRKTYGFRKKKASITREQLEKLTGISKDNISRTKKKLLEKNMIVADDGIIGIQKDYEKWKLSKQIVSKQVVKTIQIESKNYPNRKGKLSKQVVKTIQTDSSMETFTNDKNGDSKILRDSEKSLKKTFKETFLNKGKKKKGKNSSSSHQDSKKRKKKQKDSDSSDNSKNIFVGNLANEIRDRFLQLDNGKGKFHGYGKRVLKEADQNFINWYPILHKLVEEQGVEDMDYYLQVLDWCLDEDNYWFDPITQNQVKLFYEKYDLIRDQMDSDKRKKKYIEKNEYKEYEEVMELKKEDIAEPVKPVPKIDKYIKDPEKLSWLENPLAVESWLKDIKKKLGDKFNEWYEKSKDKMGEHNRIYVFLEELFDACIKEEEPEKLKKLLYHNPEKIKIEDILKGIGKRFNELDHENGIKKFEEWYNKNKYVIYPEKVKNE